MREMKDSGVQWLAEIPAEWEVSTIGALYTVRNEKVSDVDYPPLSVTMKGIVPQLETAAKTDAHDDRKLVRKGDFAINSRSDRRGSCGISDYDGSVSLINMILTPRREMHPSYYNWLFHTSCFADEFYRWGHGIVDDLWTTRWQEMKNISVTVPSYDVQEKIADYLDIRCAKIDALIANQQAQIEKLKQYKQSLITEVVTKGLDPMVPMIDSTDSILGEMPASWEYRKVKSFITMPVVDGPHESPELYSDGIPYISATAIENGKINFSLMRGYISEQYCEECDKRYRPQIGDILVIKLGASTGQVAIVETNDRFNIWVPLAAVRCNHETNPKFIYYSFQATYLIRQMELSWTFGTQQTLGVKTIERLKFLIPSIEEQNAIVSYLNIKCEKIDTLLAVKQSKIDKLNQYKKSLIYEYATGKKEVPIDASGSH